MHIFGVKIDPWNAQPQREYGVFSDLINSLIFTFQLFTGEAWWEQMYLVMDLEPGAGHRMQVGCVVRALRLRLLAFAVSRFHDRRLLTKMPLLLSRATKCTFFFISFYMIVCVLLTNIVGGVVWVMYFCSCSRRRRWASIVAQVVHRHRIDKNQTSSLENSLASSSMSVQAQGGHSLVEIAVQGSTELVTVNGWWLVH